MAFDEEAVTVFRYMINDVDSVKYTDDRLLTQLLIAAAYVQLENDLNFSYIIDPVNQRITPDPTNPNTRDDVFLWLIALKAACMVAQAELKTVGAQAIAIRDEGSAIDLKGPFAGAVATVKNFCDQYDGAKWDYALTVRVPGHGIFGPFGILTGAMYGGGEVGWQSYSHRDRPNFT